MGSITTVGNTAGSSTDYEITGEVVLQKVALLHLTDYAATLADEASELMGKKISLHLMSSDQVDPGNTLCIQALLSKHIMV